MKPVTPAKLSVVKGVSLYLPSKASQTFEVSFNEFDVLEENPKQRLTKIRFEDKHLRVFKPAHLMVSAAVLPDGRIFKVDGHTRCLAANKGVASHLKAMTLKMELYSVDSIEEVKRLYDTFDSRASVKTVQHSLQSAFKDQGLKLITPWIENGMIASSLTAAYRHFARVNGLSMNATKDQQVDAFKDAIILFDAIEPKQKKFVIGLGAGALLAFIKHGSIAADFFSDLNTSGGSEDGFERDAARMLVEYINEQRQRGLMTGDSNNQNHIGMTLACFKRSLSGRRFFSNRPMPITGADFLKI